MNDTLKIEIRELRENSSNAYIASVNEEGYPQIKCMLVLEHDDMQTQYFSTNLSSKRAQQFLKNSKASVYYCNEAQFKARCLPEALKSAQTIKQKPSFGEKALECTIQRVWTTKIIAYSSLQQIR